MSSPNSSTRGSLPGDCSRRVANGLPHRQVGSLCAAHFARRMCQFDGIDALAFAPGSRLGAARQRSCVRLLQLPRQLRRARVQFVGDAAFVSKWLLEPVKRIARLRRDASLFGVRYTVWSSALVWLARRSTSQDDQWPAALVAHLGDDLAKLLDARPRHLGRRRGGSGVPRNSDPRRSLAGQRTFCPRVGVEIAQRLFSISNSTRQVASRRFATRFHGIRLAASSRRRRHRARSAALAWSLTAAATPTACRALFPTGVTMLRMFSFGSLKKALIRRPCDDERPCTSKLSKNCAMAQPRASNRRASDSDSAASRPGSNARQRGGGLVAAAGEMKKRFAAAAKLLFARSICRAVYIARYSPMSCG